MKFNLILFAGLLSTICSFAQKGTDYPALKHYDKDHLLNIALPLGGIGTGTVSLGGRGELRDWEIMNKPAKGYSTVTKGSSAPFFSIFIKSQGKPAITSALMGPIDPSEYLHYEGRSVNNHGLPRFSEASFDAAYPFGQVNLSDKELPVKVKIKAFNPLIPGDVDASGIPVAVLTYEVTNTTDQLLEVSVCGSIRNFVGQDGSKTTKDWKGDYVPYGAKRNINVYKDKEAIKGIYMYSDSVDKKSTSWGSIALATNSPTGVTYRTSSTSNNWENALLDFWDDFSADGNLTEKTELIDDNPMASLAVKQEIAPHSTKVFSFFITWNFPNRLAWSDFSPEAGKEIVGNYYSTKYTDAWDVMVKTVPQIPELEKKTLLFVNTILSSDIPAVIKEAALFNLSVLRSQTVFRINDGHLFGWEGVFDETGSCFGSCTHVWNYEQATAFLFGDLAKGMRDVELNYATNDTGRMSFRVMLPLSKAQQSKGIAADGQMGCLMKFYRDWQLSGDNDFLRQNWGQLKKVLSFAWTKGSWDGNQDGIMEGAQGNTMDVEYYGPNPQMAFWYLGALKAMNKMAVFMGDKEFATKCDRLYKNGSSWIDANLFNGEYYEQKITDPKTFEFLNWENNPAVAIPNYQLGKGCLVDQLVGQYMAHVCGLGYLAKVQNIQTTLKSIYKYNYLPDFSKHFNNMRSYVLGDEAGLLMASWPKGRLKVPFPYFSESMAGFEYVAAIGMLYEGQTENGLQCIQSIRDRFDGRKRNPFDEPECGHHYARSMSSWAGILEESGFVYSGVDQSIEFAPREGTYFWSNGYSWGSVTIKKAEDRMNIDLNVLFGELEIKSFHMKGYSNYKPIRTEKIECDKNLRFFLKK
ncbi:MAG TPA: GH116 family glycosyl-hydrolase [Prolixibacteraceae bacterium]|jgi:uncharacterized protein (DUF608 family)